MVHRISIKYPPRLWPQKYETAEQVHRVLVDISSEGLQDSSHEVSSLFQTPAVRIIKFPIISEPADNSYQDDTLVKLSHSIGKHSLVI